MANYLLKVERLYKSFGRIPVLKNINLDINKGEILGFIGPSGTGKTTLLSIIAGVIKPDRGNIKYLDENLILNNNPTFRSVYSNLKRFTAFFGFATQTPSFYEKMTVLENLLYFGKMYRLSAATLKSNVKTLLSLMELETSKNKMAAALSGGMARRLDIACSMIHNPKLLLLDEPTSDLDPYLRDKIWKLINKINSAGTTVVLSTHSVNDLETLCTRVAILKAGRLIEVDSPSALKEKVSSGHSILIRTTKEHAEELFEEVKLKLGYRQAHEALSVSMVAIDSEIIEIIITCKHPVKVLNQITRLLEVKKNQISELILKSPSLEQAYLSL